MTSSERSLVPAKIVNQERLRERRAQLITAATQLFLSNGYHSTPIRQIASALDWNIGTLYLYVSTKEDILYLIADAIMNELWVGLSLVKRRGTATESLLVACQYFFDAVYRMRDEVKLLYRESASLSHEHLGALKSAEIREREYFAAIIHEGIERGEFTDIAVDLYAHNIIMLAHMWSLKRWAIGRETTFDEYRQQQIHLLISHLTGFRTEQ